MTAGTKVGLILALALFGIVGGYFLFVPGERPAGLGDADAGAEGERSPELARIDEVTNDDSSMEESRRSNRQRDNQNQSGTNQQGSATPGRSGSGAQPGESDLVIYWPIGDDRTSWPEIPEREVATFDSEDEETSGFSFGHFFDANGQPPPFTPSSPPQANEPAAIDNASGGDTYIVQKDDSFWTIAQSWFGAGSKQDLIAAANPGVNPQRLQIGQRLTMPPRDAARANQRAAATPPPSTPQQSPGTSGDQSTDSYTVQTGDTLVRIARKFFQDDSKWEGIYQANRATIGADPDKLRVGIRLTIPR